MTLSFDEVETTSGTGERLLQHFVIGATAFLLGPVLESHETFAVNATLFVDPTPRLLGPGQTYRATGTATFTSKWAAPRAPALRETMLAAGRAAARHPHRAA